MLKRPREHDGKHLDFVRQLPCVVCGDNTSTEAAHLRASNLQYGKRHTGMGEKPSDKWSLPVCGKHHREQHQGSEIGFWNKHGKNPFQLCTQIWMLSGDHEMASKMIEGQL